MCPLHHPGAVIVPVCGLITLPAGHYVHRSLSERFGQTALDWLSTPLVAVVDMCGKPLGEFWAPGSWSEVVRCLGVGSCVGGLLDPPSSGVVAFGEGDPTQDVASSRG